MSTSSFAAVLSAEIGLSLLLPILFEESSLHEYVLCYLLPFPVNYTSYYSSGGAKSARLTSAERAVSSLYGMILTLLMSGDLFD